MKKNLAIALLSVGLFVACNPKQSSDVQQNPAAQNSQAEVVPETLTVELAVNDAMEALSLENEIIHTMVCNLQPRDPNIPFFRAYTDVEYLSMCFIESNQGKREYNECQGANRACKFKETNGPLFTLLQAINASAPDFITLAPSEAMASYHAIKSIDCSNGETCSLTKMTDAEINAFTE